MHEKIIKVYHCTSASTLRHITSIKRLEGALVNLYKRQAKIVSCRAGIFGVL